MEATLTLHQAGNQLGVEDTVLSRLIRIGALPEARKVHRPDGDVWVIPVDAMSAVARRNGWTIDLRDDSETHGEVFHDDGATVILHEPAVHGTAVNEPGVQDSAVHEPESPEPTAEATATESTDGEETGPGALVPHGETTPAADEQPMEVGLALQPAENTTPEPSMAEAIDLALLDRLLGVQEERVTAQVEAEQTRHALSTLNDTHNRVTGELEIERRERMITADRYREERMARAVADAKIAELRDRVVREMNLADAEKEARSEALTRSMRAEREAANAVASMGWLARRRYRKLNRSQD